MISELEAEASHIHPAPTRDVSFKYQHPAVHEWRAYIPDALVKIWDLLSLEARIAAALVACEAASREEWD